MENGAVIVLLNDGRVQFWAQDSPQVASLLEAIEELSTCDCPGDQCHLDEMPGWRAQLAAGCVVPEVSHAKYSESLVLNVPCAAWHMTFGARCLNCGWQGR